MTQRVSRAARLALALCVCTGGALTATAAASPQRVQRQQVLAQLMIPHQVYRSASMRSSTVRTLPAHTPLTGERTTLPVLGQETVGQNRWLRVMLPGRPNGSTGWIQANRTRLTQTGWHIVVSLSARRVWVDYDGHRVTGFSAVVGKPSTPTPTGTFFVEETVILPATDPGGPYALALSARSNVFREFDGGPGQIAIHGRDLLGGTLGQAQSHGCVRLGETAIAWLANRIGPGVPVTIQP